MTVLSALRKSSRRLCVLRVAVCAVGTLICTIAAAEQLDETWLVTNSELTRRQIASLPFANRPTRFDAERWMLYGWRVRAQTQVRGIFTEDIAEPSERNEVFGRARLRLDTELVPHLDAYLDGRVNLRWTRSRSGNRSTVVDGELSEAWLRWDRPLSLPAGFVQAGRIKTKEERGFWWDEEIESFRIGVDTSLWEGQLGVGARLSQDEVDDDGRRELQDDLTWILFELRHQWSFDNFVEFRLLQQFDQGSSDRVGAIARTFATDEDLLWVGGRVTGRTPGSRSSHRIHYWLEAVSLTGHETSLVRLRSDRVASARDRSVSEWALDLGLTLETALPGALSFTAGFATASERFRQPSLFRNRMKFAGNLALRRYGEVLRPNLSNLHIATAAVGLAPFRGAWLQAAYHRYWQANRQPFLADDALVQAPFGRDRDFGHAVDAGIGIDFLDKWRLELIYGVFFADDAFGARDDETAHRGSALLRREWP